MEDDISIGSFLTNAKLELPEEIDSQIVNERCLPSKTRNSAMIVSPNYKFKGENRTLKVYILHVKIELLQKQKTKNKK